MLLAARATLGECGEEWAGPAIREIMGGGSRRSAAWRACGEGGVARREDHSEQVELIPSHQRGAREVTFPLEPG